MTPNNQSNINLTRSRRWYKNYLVLLGSFFVTFAVGYTFAPVQNSSATDISDTKTQNFSVSVSNPYYISITSSHATAGEPISLDYGADGNAIGNVIATSDTVTTETNSPLMHYLYLSTNSNSNALSSDNENVTDTISAGGGDDLSSASALSDNTWGFAMPSTTSGIPINAFDTDYSSVSSSSKFTKVPTSGNEVLIQQETGSGNRRDMTTSTSTVDVYYAAKANSHLPSGTYANTIRYTAYAEEPDTTTTMIDDLEYMQDITTEICNNSYTGMTARLKDKRGRGNAGSASDSSYGIIKAKDGNCWMTENFDLYNKTVSYTESDFTSGTFKIPESSNWTDTSNTKAYVHEATTSGYEDQVYYNWSAAIAIANTSSITTQQNSSICPKNWQLPVYATYGTSDTNKSFAKLMNVYSVVTGEQLLDNGHESHILGFHLYYGRWDAEKAFERDQGEWGLFWSSTPRSTTNASNLEYSSNRVAPYNGNQKAHGEPIRCVSR